MPSSTIWSWWAWTRADPPKVLVIGPRSDGQLLEVFILTLPTTANFGIHAKAVRPTFHDLLPGEDLLGHDHTLFPVAVDPAYWSRKPEL